MKTNEQVFTTAVDSPAFSNSTDGDAWMSAWCERCTHDSPRLVAHGRGCPLILVALTGMTPKEWPEQPDGGHECTEFTTTERARRRTPRRVPDPVGMDPLLPREVYAIPAARGKRGFRL
jgi:hypothetical protein